MTSTPAPPSDLALDRILGDDGVVDAERAVQISDSTLVAMHREMVRIRMIDERMIARQRQGRIGFYGAIEGQEVTPIAAAFASRPTDWVFPALRESALMLARGFPLELWLAQVYGSRSDVLRGRQMPSHQSARAVQQVSWSSCLATQLPHAVGAAWASRYRGDDRVMLAFMGDGATSEPDFHAAMTMAAVMRVPCVFVCQNNHWAISVPSERQTASKTFAIKARGYGMPGLRVDGNDPLVVYEVLRSAIERARAGEGPTLLEVVTYRLGPHSSSDDPSRYRNERDVDAWRRKDPIERLARYLRSRELLDDAAVARLRKRVTNEIDAVLARVEAEGPPELSSLFDDVYSERPWYLQESFAMAMAAERSRASDHDEG